MSRSKRVYLLRHGRTAAGPRYIGATDLPLAPEGMEDIARIAPYLHRQQIDSVHCSPLLRCRQTLDILGLVGMPQIADDLREIDFGAWEGLTFAEICAQDTAAVDRWARWSEDFSFPQGESIRNFLKRVDGIKKMVLEEPGERLLLVSHGGVIRQLVCSCLGLGPENYLLFDIQPGLCAVIDLHPEGGILAGLNQGGN